MLISSTEHPILDSYQLCSQQICIENISFHTDKPKVFLVQACRGSRSQEPVDVADDWPADIADVVGHFSVPTDANLLIAYATTPGICISPLLVVIPPLTKLWGVYWFHYCCLYVRLSVRLSVEKWFVHNNSFCF